MEYKKHKNLELSTEIIKEAVHGRGGGVTQSREAPPERGTFYQASGIYERVGISLVVVYARVGKSII